MSVEHFDSWYAAMSAGSVRDRIWQQHLGLPPEMVSSSLLSLDGLRELTAALRLGPQDVLLDLACGRGGYGMWVARETGCRVVGVDFSAVAVADAQRRVAAFGLDGRASYRVGDLAATGLDDDSVDAVLCVDAIQFAPDPVAAGAETLRVVRPGRAAVFTTWQGLDRSDAELPDRIRLLDLGAALATAGFEDVQVVDRPDWHAAEVRLWEAVAATDPGDDPAVRDDVEESAFALDVLLPRSRRVVVSGRVPL